MPKKEYEAFATEFFRKWSAETNLHQIMRDVFSASTDINTLKGIYQRCEEAAEKLDELLNYFGSLFKQNEKTKVIPIKLMFTQEKLLVTDGDLKTSLIQSHTYDWRHPISPGITSKRFRKRSDDFTNVFYKIEDPEIRKAFLEIEQIRLILNYQMRMLKHVARLSLRAKFDLDWLQETYDNVEKTKMK